MDVVVIGNPKHVRGMVTTGKITDVEDLGNDKWLNAIYLDAGLQEGNSGSPILDSNGDVLGMVWGAKSDGSGSGVAVSAKTLKLQVIDAAPWVESVAPRAELVVPRAERVVPRASGRRP
jgi:S1-C subfamily serine protease